MLEQIDALTNTGSLATIICGDQQTFARMVCLRRLDPELFSHIVPLPGEMHLCAHFLHAVSTPFGDCTRKSICTGLR